MKSLKAIESAPVQAARRHLAPDLLRGLAVLLLVLTNVPLIVTTIRYRQVSGLSPFVGNFWDDLAAAVFLAIFTMTGMGMFVLAMGQGLSGAGEDRRSYRVALVRLFVIGGIGLLHGFGVWWGDILFYYMIAGMIALYFRTRPARTQILAGACIMLTPLVLTVPDLLAQLGGVDPQVKAAIAHASAGYDQLQADAQRNYISGDIGAIFEQRATDWVGYSRDFALLGVPQLVGILLIGIGVARARKSVASWFKIARFRSLFRLVSLTAVSCYIFQLGVQIFAPEAIGTLGSLASNCQVFAAPSMAVCFYLVLIKNEHRLAGSRLVSYIVFTGRYSLSIYLLTSVVVSIVAYYFSVFARVSFAAAELLALGMFCVFMILSNLAHANGVLGPFEWLLRRPSPPLATQRPKVNTQETRHDVGNK